MEPENAPEAPEAPDQIKWVHWAYHHLRTNWEALVKPPVLIVIAATAVGAYYFGTSQSAENAKVLQDFINSKDDIIKSKDGIISLKDERIGFLNDQISAYKDRLQGATPDQAAKQITQLQAQVAEEREKLNLLYPEEYRSLSDQQKTKLLDKIDDLKSSVKQLFVYAWSIGDSPYYATDFVSFFSTNHIPAIGPLQTTCDKDQRGVLIGLKDLENPSKEAKSFSKILEESGIPSHYTNWSTGPDAPGDFDLFICGQ
jgi:hypothetical protein